LNKAGNNEQFDNDILQCKVDILRASNIIHNLIPPLDTLKNSKKQNSSDTAEISTHGNKGSTSVEKMIPADETPPLPKPAVSMNTKEEVEMSEETPEIPKFDLAEDIMAEQRRITAIKRKAPGQKTDTQGLKPEVQPVDHIIEEPRPALSEQEKIIAEIVAKDIERLCRGIIPANSNQ
jgi:hypothetical protein